MVENALSGISLAVSGVILLLVLYLLVRALYKKAGPDEALIIYGRHKGKTRGDDPDVRPGFRVVQGTLLETVGVTPLRHRLVAKE